MKTRLLSPVTLGAIAAQVLSILVLAGVIDTGMICSIWRIFLDTAISTQPASIPGSAARNTAISWMR